MSSDKVAASKQTTDDSTVGSGVGHGAISDPKTKGTGDGADTKGKVLSDQPDASGESGTSSSKEGDQDSAAAEYESTNYHPRGPPSKPVGGRPK